MSRLLIIGGCGYVGSALDKHLSDNDHDVTTLDSEERGNRSNPSNIVSPYQSLEMADLDDYDAVIWVAGRSSVKSAMISPIKAFNDNLSDLVTLARKLHGQRLLWASSASVLSDPTNGHNNIYDATKRAAEAVLPMIYPNSTAMRFGTVCGPSPNMRLDLMINRMVFDAEMNGCIHMANECAERPILAVKDLCRAVEALLTAQPGTYNLSSFNLNVGSIADAVSAILRRPIHAEEPSSTYDLHMRFTPGAGWEPTETVTSIVEDLLQFHADMGLDTFR